MKIPILLSATFLLTGCVGSVLAPPAYQTEYLEPCKAPVYPLDGKHATVEVAGIQNATELRVCAARHDRLIESVKRRDAAYK